MPKDITPELLEAVQSSFEKNIEKNERIKKLKKLLEDGRATYEEADEFAVEVGHALAEAFREHVSSDVLPDGKMYYNIASRMLPPELRELYREASSYAVRVQEALNKKARIGMKAQSPKYNEDREKGLIEYAVGAPQYDNIRKSFEEDLVNFGQAVVTDTLKANAEFQFQAGMSPVIRRNTNGGCCDWCAKLAGTYKYEDVRATGSDVYRRHRSCRCTVTYDPGDGRVQNVHTKRWESRVRGLETHPGKSKAYRIYMSEATPGKGTVKKEPGYADDKKHAGEVESANWMKRKFGGDYLLLRERRDSGKETPDCLKDGAVYMEFKRPTSVNAVEKRIRKGTNQIAAMGNPERGIILVDITDRVAGQREMVEAAKKEGKKRSKQKVLDIIIREKDDIIDIIRIKK